VTLTELPQAINIIVSGKSHRNSQLQQMAL